MINSSMPLLLAFFLLVQNSVQITEGSVNLKVQAEHISALDTLWSLYKDGTLKEGLEDLFITNEITEISGGEQVELIVTIDEQEYNKARKELSMEAQRGDSRPFIRSIYSQILFC